MQIEAKKLSDIISVAKLFLSESVVNDSLRHVTFYDKMVVARNAHAGMVYFTDFGLEKEFTTPFDMFVKLGTLLDKKAPMVKVTFTATSISWNLGSYRYKTGLADLQEFIMELPDDAQIIAAPSVFQQLLSSAAFSASFDVRQPSLCGVQIDNGMVMACNNARAYIERASVLDSTINLFIPRELLVILAGISHELLGIAMTENLVYFMYNGFMIFSLLREGTYPNLVKLFNRPQESACLGEISGYNMAHAELDRFAVFGKRFGYSAIVKIDGSQLCITMGTLSVASSEEFALTVEVESSVTALEFRVNAQCFIDGLRRFASCKIYESFLYFSNAEAEHMIMLMK